MDYSQTNEGDGNSNEEILFGFYLDDIEYLLCFATEFVGEIQIVPDYQTQPYSVLTLWEMDQTEIKDDGLIIW